MANKESYLCDSCGKELIQHSGYPVHWGLELSSVNFNRNNSGITFDTGPEPPPIDNPMHFCGLLCLGDWSRKRAESILNRMNSN